jgi:hypothetical protein
MRHRAALARAALTAAALTLTAGPSSADAVLIPSLSDPGCCAISNASKLQTDPHATANGEAMVLSRISSAQSIASLDAGDRELSDTATVNDVARDGSEKAGDSLGPEAAASKESAGPDDNSAGGETVVAAPDESALSRLTTILTRLRAAIAPGP